MAVSNTNNGEYSDHQVGHKMKWLFCCQGVYWPTMLKDFIGLTKGFQERQVHSSIHHVPRSELHAIVKPLPFRGWALDLIGEI